MMLTGSLDSRTYIFLSVYLNFYQVLLLPRAMYRNASYYTNLSACLLHFPIYISASTMTWVTATLRLYLLLIPLDHTLSMTFSAGLTHLKSFNAASNFNYVIYAVFPVALFFYLYIFIWAFFLATLS